MENLVAAYVQFSGTTISFFVFGREPEHQASSENYVQIQS